MRVVIPAGIAAFLAALALDDAGYFPHSWVWAAVVPAWAAALAALLRSRVRLGTLELWWLGGLAALTAWTAASASWSEARTQSLLEARRDVVYVAVALAAAAMLDRRRARAVPAAVLVAAAGVVVLGLGRYLLPGGRRPEPFEGYLLSWPLGYANGAGALAAIGVPLALGLGAHARTRAARAAAAAALAPFLAALVLSSSRGGAVATIVGTAVLLWLDPRRRAVARLAALGAVPAAGVVAACAATRLASSSLGAGDVGRAKAIVAAVLLAGAAALAAAASGSTRCRRRRLPARGALGAAAVLAAAAGAVLSALPRLGGSAPLRQLVGSARAAYWDVGWHEAAARPLAGTGAGTFGRRWLLAGAPEGSALDAHNLYLETLGELGAVGLMLLLAAVATPLAAARRAAATSRLGAAAAAGYVAFLVHALVDWDWELPAVTCAGVVLGGSLLVLARRPGAASSAGRVPVAAAAIVLAALALLGIGSRAVPSAAVGATTARGPGIGASG